MAGLLRQLPGLERAVADVPISACVAVALVASVASADPPAGPDSLRVRFEVGGSCDYSNEICHLDSLATPTLTERQRFETPLTLGAGVVLVGLDGTRAGRATGYAFTQEVSIVDQG